MKPKYHLLKNKIYIQLTDGSIYRLNGVSKLSFLKLNVDPKSHTLWKQNTGNIITQQQGIYNFIKRFVKKNK